MSNRYEQFRSYTLRERLPRIVASVVNAAVAAGVGNDARIVLEEIAADVPVFTPMGPVPPGWQDWVARFAGQRPSEMPFFDFEYWMYCRLLQLTGYFETGYDLFSALKRQELGTHLPAAVTAFEATHSVADALALSLNGNSMDLSQIAGRANDFMIGDATTFDSAMEGQVLNIIGDNYGSEFLSDVILAVRHIERSGQPAYLHVKQAPLFVSDTTASDVADFLRVLGNSPSPFADSILRHVAEGRLSFPAHDFWSSPYDLSAIPDDAGITPQQFTILKGDLNYRRALGDVVCPIESRFETLDILPRYRMLALRSVKSYCLAGIDMETWPASLSVEGFPMDGSIFTAQDISGGGI